MRPRQWFALLIGITYGIPAPGTTMGVGDEVEVIIETEFTKSTT